MKEKSRVSPPDVTLPLKTENDITEAVEHFNQCIQQAAWNATPANSTMRKADESSALVRQKNSRKTTNKKTMANN